MCIQEQGKEKDDMGPAGFEPAAARLRAGCSDLAELRALCVNIFEYVVFKRSGCETLVQIYPPKITEEIKTWEGRDSNPRHTGLQPDALPG